MNVTVLICGLSLLLAALMWKIAFPAGRRICSLEDWERSKFVVNINSVALLIDREEDLYLKDSLPANLFRRIQRRRTLLAIKCLKRVDKNAAMLQHLAQTGAANENEHTAAAARLLSTTAAHVRLNALISIGWLWLKWAFPAAAFRIPSRWLDYRRLVEVNLYAALSDRKFSLPVSDGPGLRG
jgi:hypothetical protein